MEGFFSEVSPVTVGIFAVVLAVWLFIQPWQEASRDDPDLHQDVPDKDSSIPHPEWTRASNH